MPVKPTILRQYLTSNGLANGPRDMRVNTPTQFWIEAPQTGLNMWITSVQFTILDANSTLPKFGNIAALTNGCRLLTQSGAGTNIIHDSLKSNWDFIHMCLCEPSFGDAGTLFKINSAVGNSDGFCPVLDLARIVPGYGIWFPNGSGDKLILEVRDNTTAVDAFTAVAYGFVE